MKTNGHLPVLAAVVACLIYTAVPSRRGDDTPNVSVATAAEPPVEDASDPKFGQPQPVLRGRVWEPTAFDLRMKIPSGWIEHERRGRQYLSREVEQPREGNISVISLPNFLGKDLDGLLEENRRELAMNEAFELEQARKMSLGGRELLRIDYRGKPGNGEDELRFVCLMYRSGRNNVALTVTVREEVWPEIAESVERCLASLQFG